MNVQVQSELPLLVVCEVASFAASVRDLVAWALTTKRHYDALRGRCSDAAPRSIWLDAIAREFGGDAIRKIKLATVNVVHEQAVALALRTRCWKGTQIHTTLTERVAYIIATASRHKFENAYAVAELMAHLIAAGCNKLLARLLQHAVGTFQLDALKMCMNCVSFHWPDRRTSALRSATLDGMMLCIDVIDGVCNDTERHQLHNKREGWCRVPAQEAVLSGDVELAKRLLSARNPPWFVDGMLMRTERI